MAPPLTKPSTLRLSDVAKHVVVPKGVVSTGWPAVEGKCAEFGVHFRWWQKPIGQIILSKRDDGKYAATIGGTGLSIPRQVGKTFLVGAIIFALCLLRPGLTVIWTAHRLRTAEETFGKMQKFARRKKIAPHVLKVVLGSGEEAVEFRNGSRILFGARERGFGRGFDEVDVVVYDEAQILTENALDDMIPATNQCRQPEGALLLFMGTPPKPTDPGEVFTRMRSEALTGEDDDTGWVEFGADEDYKPTELPAPLTEADWKQVARANPSYPEDTPREAILRMRKKLGADSFRREGMGIWDKVETHEVVIPLAQWAEFVTNDPPAEDDRPTALAVDRWFDGTTSIAAGWRREEDTHVELVAVDVAPDPTRVLDWIVERAGKKLPVVIASDSPAASLAPALKARKVKVALVATSDYAKACGAFVDDAKAARVTHADQTQLNNALMNAAKQPIGKAGAFGWDRRNPDIDISALVAATLAHFGATARKKTGGGGGARGSRASSDRRSSSGRQAVVM